MSKSNTNANPSAVITCICGTTLQPDWDICPAKDCHRPAGSIPSRLAYAYSPTSLTEGVSLLGTMGTVALATKLATDLSTGGVVTATAAAGVIHQAASGNAKDQAIAADTLTTAGKAVLAPAKWVRDWFKSDEE
tara:strand:- start:848 stop:1249 length:402 start_codon:yes stop_codon:yes gene_type:complete